MKKYFLSFFIFLFLLIQTLTQPLLTFAAGETWTWVANGQIQVTGGQMNKPSTVSSTDGLGSLDVKGSNSLPGSKDCIVSIHITLSADKKSAVIKVVPPTGGIGAAIECPASIEDPYNGTTVQIGGTPTNPGGGINLCPSGQYPFTVTYFNGNADAIPPAPASINFVIGNQTKAAKGAVENGAFGVDVSYTASFCLGPGAQKVCVQPPQPGFSCADITMPKAPFSRSFGQRNNNMDVNVGVMLVNNTPGPYSISISGNGIKQTIQGKPAGNQGTECSLQVTGTFFKIKPGSYQVCYVKNNQCVTLNQVAGTPGNVSINVSQTQQNGQSACVNDPTPLPPPPSPPCKQWGSNGICQNFGSTFGGFSTDPSGFIQKIFAILLSVSGGIALLLIMKAGYQLMTAQGNPEKLNNGREQLVAAVVGLVFLIFSFVFLQLIGYDILHIPGFTGPNGGTAATGPGGGTCPAGSCIPLSICTVKNPGHCNPQGCPGGQACVQ